MSMKIFTNLITKMHGNTEVTLLNIHHIHFETFDDEVSVDSVYMEEGETILDHMEFKTDAAGVELKYKILV